MSKMLSTSQAAAYLGVSVATIKHHVYKAKDLLPERIAGRLVFDKSALDLFNKNRRKGGRPHANLDTAIKAARQANDTEAAERLTTRRSYERKIASRKGEGQGNE